MGVWDFEEMPAVVKSYSQAIQRGMAEATRRIATIGTEVIIDATPVLTTRAVSNWKVYIGKMRAKELQPLLPGDGSRETAAARGAAARNLKKAESRERIKFYKKGSQPIWFTNSVPYIKILERGGPTTRPYWMVQKGLLAMSMYARTIQIIKEGFKSKG